MGRGPALRQAAAGGGGFVVLLSAVVTVLEAAADPEDDLPLRARADALAWHIEHAIELMTGKKL